MGSDRFVLVNNFGKIIMPQEALQAFIYMNFFTFL